MTKETHPSFARSIIGSIVCVLWCRLDGTYINDQIVHF